ncbi:MAG: DUF2167 domain-containing protein [Rhizobiales bacterium]|nr:DUF2167 domain-containing protein [Hyphomicrobiales bacterium]
MAFRYLRSIIVILAFATCLVPAQAQDEQLTPAQLAWQAAYNAAKPGPSDITLGEQAVLHLPPEMAFMPRTESEAFMKAVGNGIGEGFFGIVVPKSESQFWIMTVNHTAQGYVKDDDAKSWNADELLQSLKDGTEEQNKERERLGVTALDIIGWIESPHYDAGAHRLVWSMKAVDRGAASDALATVNFNTYALGRDGYFEFNLITTDDVIGTEKPYAQAVLAALDYKPGKRYEDFDASTDHIAEYGLAALIGGVAAKKLGLLALAGAFLAKFAKVIFVVAAVAGGAIFKFFRRKRNREG